ncbi:L-lysine 6-monooxygenase, partial [Pseudomonas syringae]
TDTTPRVFRDRVTPRSPGGGFPFAMHPREHGRMFGCGLLGRPASRQEWSDYLAWVAAEVGGQTCFNTPVTGSDPVLRHGRLHELRVCTPDTSFPTRNVVTSSGSAPRIPHACAALTGPTLVATSPDLTRPPASCRQLHNHRAV